MVETNNYLMVGFEGNSRYVGFENNKTPPSKVYFDYLGVGKNGELYVECGDPPLSKLLHPDYEDAENILKNPTKIGSVLNSNF